MKKTFLVSLLVLMGGCSAAFAQDQAAGVSGENYAQPLAESIEMVYVEGGEFMMGATPEQGDNAKDVEKPAHKVKVSSFYISKYEITQAQYKAIMGTYYNNFEGDRLPIEIKWDIAMEFCEKLSKWSGKKYTLPTEAQWEYAARGGNKSKGYKYSGSNDPDEVAWYFDNADGTTHTVGTKAPNELGLYDMSGNVYEWCLDGPRAYSSKEVTNPMGSTDELYRVMRGGSWGSSARNDCRVASRSAAEYYTFDSSLGFRIVCIIPESK